MNTRETTLLVSIRACSGSIRSIGFGGDFWHLEPPCGLHDHADEIAVLLYWWQGWVCAVLGRQRYPRKNKNVTRRSKKNYVPWQLVLKVHINLPCRCETQNECSSYPNWPSNKFQKLRIQEFGAEQDAPARYQKPTPVSSVG